MHTLANPELCVTLLDPAVDGARLGPRFCSGGYIWQITDTEAGPLLSGPEGPEPAPDPFNGHGLPEAFRDRTRAGEPLTWQDGRGLAPGVGLLERDAEGRARIVEPCRWETTHYHDRVVFHTEHGHQDRRYALSRMIQLVDRDVHSITRFSNTGRSPLALQWFAHPFFALDPQGLVAVELPHGCRLPDNPGFVLDGRRLSLRRRFTGKDDGHFELLQLPPERNLVAHVSHPRLSRVTLETSFAPSECPVWANGHTFSIEPYQTLRLEPAQTRHWTLRYGFGARRAATPASARAERSVKERLPG